MYHRIPEFSELEGSSGGHPVQALPRQGHLEQVTQEHVQVGLECPREGDSTASLGISSRALPPPGKQILPHVGVKFFCGLVYGHCSLSCCWAPPSDTPWRYLCLSTAAGAFLNEFGAECDTGSQCWDPSFQLILCFPHSTPTCRISLTLCCSLGSFSEQIFFPDIKLVKNDIFFLFILVR